LDSSKWTVTDIATGRNVTQAVTDNNLETLWAGDGGKGLLIDLGQEAMVHRIYLNPGSGEAPQSLKVSFLSSPDDRNPVVRSYSRPKTELWKARENRKKMLEEGVEDILPVAPASETRSLVTLDINIRFNPVKARCLRIEGPARVAELELYGGSGANAFKKGDAVSLDKNAPELLRQAAEDLRYYIGELTGNPIPIIPPEAEPEYPGTIYRIEDLKRLAPDYPTMLENLKSGKLPTGGPLPETVVSLQTLSLPDGVNVERDGRKVVFRAWPYRNVASSVWEFLRRQGVRWVYPDDHGDFVPNGKGVDLGILPLRNRPSAEWRFANFPIPHSEYYPPTEAFLYFARNGYNSDWNPIRQFLGQHNEVPAIPAAQTRDPKQVKPENREGFEGSPHNFQSLIPNRLLEEHPDWCGMTEDGKRLPPNKGGPTTFCLTSKGAVQFVADKVLDWVGDNKECRVKFKMVPMDSCKYCQCEECQKLYKPYEKPDLPWVPGMNYTVSDAYYYFVSEIGKRIADKAPGARIDALAYADALTPPRKIEKLPDNVWVQVCQYGSRNLPMSSPANAAMRQCMETWAAKCGHLQNYEYALIEGEWMELPMPLPSITAIVDRSKFLHKLGAWNGGTQSWIHCLPHNPWNHYAYARMLWDVAQDAAKIKDEFFNAYYQEAAPQMREYYETYESHVLKNNIDLQNFGYDQGPNPYAFPPEIVAAMGKSLDQAKQAAKSWFVKQRVETARKDFDWSVPASLRRSMDKGIALNYGKKEYLCGRKKGEITINGKLDEEAWKAAPASGGFILPKTFEAAPGNAQSEFRMLWDDDTLYIAVRCVNPNIASLKETDAIWGQHTDSLEMLFVSERNYAAAYYQIALSAFNKTFGPVRCIHDQWHKDTEWKGEGIKTAVQRGDGSWTCEIAVPFKILKEGAPKAGDWWRVNIARNYPGGASSWSPLQVGAWMLYRDFNFVVFAADASAIKAP
ncbi:MAG: DUF4838 domain-containing protein, partial [Planctomycetota bacterium]|nr:DUF4838 domain-containing protein [Planctomycetota bacterium]